MKMRQLYKNFPSTKEGAELYGGFMYDDGFFCRIFETLETLEDTVAVINKFLDANGYAPAELEEFDETYAYRGNFVSISLNPYDESEMIVTIEKDHFALSQMDFITEELLTFRDERDWEQFHNSKDLALALSIEASELNELFLWKSAESVDVEKLKDELADVISFTLLLAAKHNLNIESIVLDKIKKNDEKYPVDKSKGTATKYNKL